MKQKLFIILAAIALHSCSAQTQETQRQPIYNTIVREYKVEPFYQFNVADIEGCQYVVVIMNGHTGIVHKQNCRFCSMKK